MRKKTILFLLFIAVLTGIFPTYVCAVDVSASSAIVYVAESGEILYEKDAYIRRSMASTTKIMTAVIALESDRLGDIVTLDEKMTATEGTSMGLKPGDRITLENLIKGMMLLSGNDAAKAIAVYLGGGEEGFSDMMNRKAVSLGMRDTNFVTASGLDDEMHYTTAFDMALLTSYAMRNADFRNMVSMKKDKVEYVYPQVSYTYSNHNRFLSMYEGACGVKTGFTKKSGRCLVTAVEKQGNLVIAVTLNAADDWNDHIKLYDYCFSQAEFSKAPHSFDTYISVVGSINGGIRAKAEYIPEILSTKQSVVSTAVYTDSFLYAPVKKGEQVGFIRFSVDGVAVRDVPLLAEDNAGIKVVEKERKGLLGFFFKIYKKLSGE